MAKPGCQNGAVGTEQLPADGGYLRVRLRLVHQRASTVARDRIVRQEHEVPPARERAARFAARTTRRSRRGDHLHVAAEVARNAAVSSVDPRRPGSLEVHPR